MEFGTECKRITVRAWGIDLESFNIAYTTNGNYTENGCSGEPGNCGCYHAETNLLMKVPHPDLVIVSLSPCLDCAKALVKANVKRVEYLDEYRITDGIEYLKANGVDVRRLQLER